MASDRWPKVTWDKPNTRQHKGVKPFEITWPSWGYISKPQQTSKNIKNFWVLHVNHFQSAIRQMAHGLGQALHSSRRAAEDVPPCPGRANGVISAGDPGSPPRLLAAVGRPLVNDLQLFCSCLQIQMCPNVSKWKSTSELQAMLEFHQHLFKWSFTGITTQLLMTCTLKHLTCGRSR